MFLILKVFKKIIIIMVYDLDVSLYSLLVWVLQGPCPSIYLHILQDVTEIVFVASKLGVSFWVVGF